LIDLDIQARVICTSMPTTRWKTPESRGQAFAQALGDKKGIRRYGHAYVPPDEALSRVVIDLSGRPGLEYHVDYTRARIGEFDVDLFLEFFRGFINHAGVTLHIDNLRGINAHHQAETIFRRSAARAAWRWSRRAHGDTAVDERCPVSAPGWLPVSVDIAVIDYGVGNLRRCPRPSSMSRPRRTWW
jgi:hypothetical protein